MKKRVNASHASRLVDGRIGTRGQVAGKNAVMWAFSGHGGRQVSMVLGLVGECEGQVERVTNVSQRVTVGRRVQSRIYES